MKDERAMHSHRTFGRRTFIKGSAAALGIAALAGAGCSPSQQVSSSGASASGGSAASPDEIFYGACRSNCFGGCRVKIAVRDGKVVSSTMGEFPNEEYNRVCQKGLAHLQRIYDPDRVKKPMRRVEGSERGAGEWEEVSWDEAIEDITTKWKQYQEESGPESIGFFSGSGCYGAEAAQYTSRLQQAMHGSTINGAYDSALFAGGGWSKGTGVNEIIDIKNAKTIISWGANPSEAQTQTYHFLMDAQENGTKLISIDPNWTVISSKADQWIPIRPGTDNVMVMAMVNIAVENGFIDADYVKIGTVGPFLVKESDGKYLRMSDLGVEPEEPKEGQEPEDPFVLMGADGEFGPIDEVTDPVYEGSFEVEGQKVTCAFTLFVESCKEWTPARAAEICDVPEETIRELTRVLFEEGPTTIYTGLGPDHYVNGHPFYFTVTGLAAITGNMGKPGATCGYDWPVYGRSVAAVEATIKPDWKAGPTIPAMKLLDVVNDKELEGLPIDLRSLYIWISNPVGNQTERKAMLEAFDKIDLVVVSDIVMSDTALYADYVLPVVHWFETLDVNTMTSPYLTLQEQAIEPLYESKNDFDIINLLAKGMGFEEDFSMTIEEWLQFIIDNNPNAQRMGITWERMLEEKIVRCYDNEPYFQGKDGVYPTPTKREQLYRETPTPYVQYGQSFDVEKERLPYWEPPTEAWPETVAEFTANPLAEQYPLIYTTERNKLRSHTQFKTPWMLEIYPEPVVRMNPADAESRGLAEGDYVRLFNDRGDVTVKLTISPHVRPGLVIMPKGWERDQFKAGHYSDLTSRVFNPVCPNNCYYDALIQVEKA